MGDIRYISDTESTILDEAARIVNGDRQDSYGHPMDNHACTAAFWSVYMFRRSGEGSMEIDIDAYDVCIFNILQKISRLANDRHRDGLIDIAGFARNAEIVQDCIERERS